MTHSFRRLLLGASLAVAAALLAAACGGGAPEPTAKPAKATQASSRTVRASSATARPKTPAPTKAASHAPATAASVHGAAPAVEAGHATAPAAADAHAAAPADAAHAAPHWEYLGHSGQQYWGELSKDFTACVDGSAQTPIDIRDTVLTPLTDVEFHYQPAPISVLNNGHTIQANFPQGGGYMVVDGKQYQLLQFHLHGPSEHTVGGKQFLMELHLVHKSADGTLAVLGVFLDRGNHNSRLDPIWGSMPAAANAALNPPGLFDVTTLFPADQRTYRYAGSLTTPPCSEGVKWHLFKAPVEMSAAQAQAFKGIVGYNSRYVQPLNGREVQEDSAMDH